jgi:hypothetical protein
LCADTRYNGGSRRTCRHRHRETATNIDTESDTEIDTDIAAFADTKLTETHTGKFRYT